MSWGSRRLQGPELLVGAGLLLLAVAAAVWLLLPGPHHHAAPPPAPTTTAVTPAPPPPPPPPPKGLFATEPKLAPTSPSSVELRFATTEPARVSVAYGIDGEPATLWAAETKPATKHALALDGAVLTRQYRVEIAVRGAKRHDAKELILAPRALGAAPRATVGRGVLHLDGHPFFPLMSWSQCAPDMTPALAAGINLFLDDPCGGAAQQAATLQGKALFAGMATDTGTGAGQVGYIYPDEADGLGLDASGLPTPVLAGPGRVAFLSLTNHFFSGAAPLPQGRGMYPPLVAKADVVGFDLYPLQEWCRPERIVDVANAQRELVRLAAGKPTFQWIESGPMSKCNDPADAVTPAALRAETWLAVAGGAHGIGFFPPQWDASLTPTVTQLTRELDALAPALLLPPTTASSSSPLVVRAWNRHGALYVVAVNPSVSASFTARIAVRGLGSRAPAVLDEGRSVQARAGTFADAFAPLAAHVYVVPPQND